MCELTGRLQEKETLLGRGEVDSAPPRTVDQRLVIIFRAERKKGYLQPAAPSELAMALGVGAIIPIQNRRDVAQKLHARRRLGRNDDCDRFRSGLWFRFLLLCGRGERQQG